MFIKIIGVKIYLNCFENCVIFKISILICKQCEYFCDSLKSLKTKTGWFLSFDCYVFILLNNTPNLKIL